MQKLIYPVLFLFSFNISAQVSKLGPQGFYLELKKYSNPQLLDIRSSDLFEKGHLKKAYNIDLASEEFESMLLQYYDVNKPLFIYCQTGKSSIQSEKYFEEMGYKDIKILVGGFEKWTVSSKPYVSSQNTTRPLAYMTIQNLNEAIKTNEWVLVDFYADWCGPCKKMEPILQKIKSENKNLTLLKIDSDKNASIVEKYEVEEIPTFLIFHNGKQVWRRTGLLTENEIKSYLF
jgi:thioredoxin 1